MSEESDTSTFEVHPILRCGSWHKKIYPISIWRQDMTSSENEVEARDEAVAAARWWGDWLWDIAGLGRENDEPVGMLSTTATPVADIALDSYDITGPRIARFEHDLALAISDELGRYRDDAVQVSRGSDPKRKVAKALRSAGIRSAGMFLPREARMWVRPGEVKVSAAQGSELISIPIS